LRRRTFFRRLLGSLGVAVAGPQIHADESSVTIQESSIAGFQFHEGQAVWQSLAVGNDLRLVRESSNAHDSNAVAVYFGEHKLGYVPRAENNAVAQMIDRGERLHAKISQLGQSSDPWERVRITISLA
jgi:hypothetical protein